MPASWDLQRAPLSPVLGWDTHGPQVSRGLSMVLGREDPVWQGFVGHTLGTVSPRAGSHSRSQRQGHFPEDIPGLRS